MRVKPICNIDLNSLLDWITAEQGGEPEIANGADILNELQRWVNDQQPVITDARCGNCGSELFMPSGPLTQRLRAAAETIEELNSMSGYDADAAQRAAVSAMYLRHEADELEKP